MNTAASAIISKIEALSKRDEDYDLLLREVQELGPLLSRSIGATYEPGVILCRGTGHHRILPTRIEDVWYPPRERVTDFGRANRPYSPVFYCCSDHNGAFLEVGTKRGQYAVLSKWRTTKRLVVQDVGYTAAVFARAGATRAISNQHASFHRSLTPDQRELYDFLALTFTEPSPKHYRITAAIAEMFMACDGLSGIKYPTVTKSADVDNFALRPEFVRTGLELCEGFLAFVTHEEPGRVNGPIIARLTSGSESDLNWKFDGPPTNLAPQHVTKMHFQAGERQHFGSAGRLTINGKDYDILPGYSIEAQGAEAGIRDLKGVSIQPISKLPPRTGSSVTRRPKQASDV